MSIDSALTPPQTRIVDQHLTIRFLGAEYAVPFAQIGQHLPVSLAVGLPGVFVFPDGWHPGISASVVPARNPRCMRQAQNKPTPPGTASSARKKPASSHPVVHGAHPATPPEHLHGRKPGSFVEAARAIHLLPLPAELSAFAQKSCAGRTGSDK